LTGLETVIWCAAFALSSRLQALLRKPARSSTSFNRSPQVLLKDDSDRPVMKLADFGLSQLIEPNTRLLKVGVGSAGTCTPVVDVTCGALVVLQPFLWIF
jgi:hypothetical protein